MTTDATSAARARALALLRRHGWNATSFQILEPGFNYWFDGDDACVAYIDTGRFVICSASPELFFELEGETLTSRPMKGTTKRGRTTIEDRVEYALSFGMLGRIVHPLVRRQLKRIFDYREAALRERFASER